MFQKCYEVLVIKNFEPELNQHGWELARRNIFLSK